MENNYKRKTYPFEIVPTDLFHYAGRDFLLIVDNYSGYFETEMEKSSAETHRIFILYRTNAKGEIRFVFNPTP